MKQYLLTFDVCGITSGRQAGVEGKHEWITGTCAVGVEVSATADFLGSLLVAFKLFIEPCVRTGVPLNHYSTPSSWTHTKHGVIFSGLSGVQAIATERKIAT